MKRAIFLLVTLAPCAFAQTDAGKLLARGLQGTVLGATPVSAKDQAALLQAAAGLLAKHVTFRPDDSASSFFNSSGRQQVEWKALVVRSITHQPVNEADRLNGTTRRCLVALSCDAHRTWDFKANAWGKWLPIGNPFFPSAFMFDWKINQWTSQDTDQLNRFTPGPGLATALANPAATRSDSLPPGMTRGK